MLRKSTFDKFGLFDEQMHQNGMMGPEDYELWIRLSKQGCKFVRVPVVGLVYGTDAPDRLTPMACNGGMMLTGMKYIAHKHNIPVYGISP